MTDKIRCIVVDDTPSMVSLIARYLEKYPSVEVQTTTDDRQAMSGPSHGWINEQPVDLLFTDLEMPYHNGLDMLAALEKQPNSRAFLVTGSRITPDQVASPVLLDVLHKPLSQKRFDQAMEVYLTSQQG